jgi:hypothetical protein
MMSTVQMEAALPTSEAMTELPAVPERVTKRLPGTKAPAGRTDAERVKRVKQLKDIEAGATANRFVRFSTQNRFVLYTLLTLATLQALSQFVTSYAGIYAAAEWAFGQNVLLQSIAPLGYDVAIIVFTLKLFSDREEGQSVLWDYIWIGVLAGVSAFANVIHTFDVSTAVTTQQLVIGSIISGASPLLLALTADVAASRVFKKVEAAE